MPRTPASIKDHPIHLMLIPLPIGLWAFALFADIESRVMETGEWRTVAMYCMAGGVVGAFGPDSSTSCGRRTRGSGASGSGTW
jgi:uncharacterized membrane protein